MIIRIKIAGGRKTHAARYNPDDGSIKLFCNSLKFETYLAAVSDPTPPTAENINCRRCLKNEKEWGVESHGE